MKLPGLFLAVLSAACATTGNAQPSSDRDAHDAFLSRIEKRLNHHTDIVSHIAPVVLNAENSDVRYHIVGTRRDTKQPHEIIWIIVGTGCDQPDAIQQAFQNKRPIALERRYSNPNCKENWCPTERVALKFSALNLDGFSEHGLNISLSGAAGPIEIAIPAEYLRAFRDSFCLPPEWTTVAKGF